PLGEVLHPAGPDLVERLPRPGQSLEDPLNTGSVEHRPHADLLRALHRQRDLQVIAADPQCEVTGALVAERPESQARDRGRTVMGVDDDLTLGELQRYSLLRRPPNYVKSCSILQECV